MTMSPELTALRDEAMGTSCASWAIRKRWKLSKGSELVGPCPKCGGEDRFGINPRKDLFNCRKCGITGSGVIDLVMKTEDVEFIRACEIITGRSASDPVNERRMAQLRRQAEERERRDADEAARYREAAIKAGQELWRASSRIDFNAPSIVGDYLDKRALDLGGVGDGIFRTLRFHPLLPWTERASGGEGWHVVHTGPAMVAAVQLPDDKFGAVHMTWLDLRTDRGKLVLPADAEGHERPSKKVRGSKKGGAIRLYTPPGARRIVMGEGIETTLTPLCHAIEPQTAYWAGIDVGNMGGRALKIDGTTIHEQPDLDDTECFLPPGWCEEMVYLGEGDEASVHSREKCLRGLARAVLLRDRAIEAGEPLKRLRVVYVPPPAEGKDMNDLAIADAQRGDGGNGDTTNGAVAAG